MAVHDLLSNGWSSMTFDGNGLIFAPNHIPADSPEANLHGMLVGSKASKFGKHLMAPKNDMKRKSTS